MQGAGMRGQAALVQWVALPAFAPTCSREAVTLYREGGPVPLRESMPPLFTMVSEH